MEILFLLLEENTYGNPSFDFHPKCANLKLNHLCFADDLLIFLAATRAVSEPIGLEVPPGLARSELELGTVETRSIN
jgi:hypothetical protein